MTGNSKNSRATLYQILLLSLPFFFIIFVNLMSGKIAYEAIKVLIVLSVFATVLIAESYKDAEI